MVFESIVADVVNRFLNKFVENVNKTQLNIGIWGGDVVFEKLILKEGALDSLDLPIRTTYGHLGKLVLKIPWKKMYTAPVLIYVENLFLLAVPNRDLVYDPIKEEKWIQDQKENELKRVEEAKKRQAEETEVKPDDTFIEKLITQIIKNIQIKINEIHIRYEDRYTHPERPFAIGITLFHFYVYTTDENWQETIIHENVRKINKVVVIDSLAVYWNCNCRHFNTNTGHSQDDAHLQKQFKDTICTQNYLPQNFYYILGPINATTRSVLNSKPELDDFLIPKYQLNIRFGRLTVAINRFQYHDMIRLAESLNRMKVSAPCRKYRPDLNTYKGNYRVWWLFAYTCVLQEIVLPALNNWRWDHIAAHREKCRKYASAFRSKLMAKHISEEQELELKELQKDIDVFNIILIREQVEMELEKEGLLNEETDNDKGLTGWFRSSRAAGWFRNTPEKPTTGYTSGIVQHKLKNVLTPREKEQLYKIIGYKENSGPASYPKTFVEIRIQFNLDSFEVKITDNLNTNSQVLHLALSIVKVDVERLPAIKGIKVAMLMQRLTVHGLPRGRFTPMLVVSKDLPNKVHLLDLLFELNSPIEGIDHRLHLHLTALQIVYDVQTIRKINSIFRAQNLRSYHRLQIHLENVKNMSASGLRYAIERRRALDLHVNVEASYLIIPCNGTYRRKEDILIINLGHVRINSSPRSIANHSSGESTGEGVSILKTMISQSYDKFICNLEAMQVLFALQGEGWFHILQQNEVTPLHILAPMSITAIYNKCLITDDPKLPIFKITASISNIGITITNIRLRKCCILLLSILPHSVDFATLESPSLEIKRTPSSSKLLLGDLNSTRTRQTSVVKGRVQNTPKEEAPSVKKVQAIILDVTCKVEHLTVHILLEQTPSIVLTNATKFLILQMIDIEFEMVKETFNTNIVARLGGIFAEVLHKKGPIPIIDTPTAKNKQVTDKYLVTVNFIMVDEMSPELHTEHHNTSKYLQIQITSINLLLHQDVVLYVLEVLKTFLQELKTELREIKEATTETKSDFKVSHQLFVDRLRARSTMVTRSRHRQMFLMNEETAFRLQIDLHEVNVSIANSDTPIADAAIKGCYVKATLLGSSKKFVIHVGKIEMLDCHQLSLHPCILSVVGDEMLTAELVMYKLDPFLTRTVDTYPDMVIKAKIACIRIVYLNRFFSLLLMFISKVIVYKTLFQDETFVVVGGTPAQKQADTNGVSYTKINIDLDAPIFIVPLNSKSLDAVMLDFGYLTIKNEHQTLNMTNEEGMPALIDYIELILQNIKVDRVKLKRNYDVVNKKSLLLPINFFIVVERNLSMSWHTSVPSCDITMRLEELHFTLTEEDYKMIRNIMNQNFSETYVVSLSDDETANVNVIQTENEIFRDRLLFDANSFLTEESETTTHVDNSQTVTFKISFSVDSISVTLYTGGAATLDDSHLHVHRSASLARFTLQTLCLEGRGISNGKTMMTFRVVNCFLDDMREGRTNADVRLLQRLDMNQEPLSDELEFSTRTLLDVSYTKKNADTCIEVCVHGFQLILSLEYVAQLRDFFISHRKTLMYRPGVATRTSFSTASAYIILGRQKRKDTNYNQQPSNMLVNIKFENPEIVVVENVDNPNNDALIMSSEIVSKLHSTGTKVFLSATIKELQLNSGCIKLFKRKPKSGFILRPCTVSVLGSVQNQGDINLDLCITEIKIGLSPSTIDLLRKMYTVLYGDSNKFVDTADENINHSEIWDPRDLSEEEFWFFQENGMPEVDFNERVQKSNDIDDTPVSQICVISIPSCLVFVESGEGKLRQPLIFMHVKLESIVYDWSYNLSISTNIGLKVTYYNITLASWEPLVEPIERLTNKKRSQSMWEFKANIQMNPRPLELSRVKRNLANLSVTISSSEKLEVTLTKTGIDIVSKLIKFVLESSGETVTGGTLAPFVVKNMTGLTIIMVLRPSPFKVVVEDKSSRQSDVILASGSQLGLCLKENELTSEVATSPDGNERSISIVERFLSIKVEIDSEYSVLSLPVYCTDMRFFCLRHHGEFSDNWGLLWDISICEGSTVLTLRGIVKVYNHLKQPIHIYHLWKKGMDHVHVGTVDPSDELNLPVQSVYTETGALFFSVKGYNISKESFMWKDLKNRHTLSKLLSCSEKQQGEGGLFYMNVFGVRKQLYYEITQRYTKDSAMYNIHIHPGVLIKNFLPVDIMICLHRISSNKNDIIKAGEQMHMVNVEPKITKLFIKIPNYLNKEWLSEDSLEWDPQPFDIIRFTSNEDDQQEVLEIYVFTIERNGTICKQLSCQFWMLNKTGLDLAYRQDNVHENTCLHPKDFQEVILFSLWGTGHGKKKLSIQVSNGQWSNNFSLGAAGSSGVVCCKLDRQSYYIGVNISLTRSKLTQQVTFTPYYVLVNNHSVCIECQESDCTDNTWVTVKPGDCTPFWPYSSGNRKEVSLRMENIDETSIPFSYFMVHTTLIKLNNKYGAVFVDVHKMEGGVFVTFWPYKLGLAPTLLINHTDRPIQYWEQNETGTSTLNPRQIQLYTWSKPTGTRTLTYRFCIKGELTDNLQKDGVEELAYKSGERIYWVSFLDGNQRITLFTEDAQVAFRVQLVRELEPIHIHLTLSIHSIGISFVNNNIMKEVMYITISSEGATWEGRKRKRKRFKPLEKEKSQLIEAAYLKYSEEVRVGLETQRIVQLDKRFEVNLHTKEILQPYRRSLRRIYDDGVWFCLQMMSHHVTMHGKIARLQIDNQMNNSVFPVVLAPVPPPKTVQADQMKKPFAEMSIIRRYMEHSPVKHYKYFMILIQAFHVKVEMDFVNALSNLFDWENVPEHVEVLQFVEDVTLAREPLRTNVYSISSQDEKHFYDILHVSPLKIHVSFSLITKHNTEGRTLPFVMFILHGLGVTLADFDNVVLKLGCFERKYTFLSHSERYHEITSHYISQFLKQTYVLVLGLDLIGNPWGFFMGIRQGVTDLFYEPYQGIIQGPEDFGEGLLLGLRSMFGNTVGGTFGAVSKFSGAIGTGIAVLTFDNNYQHKRKKSINEVSDDVARFTNSGKSLVMGVVEGVSGVVSNPIAGAHREGVRGFFKGMGRGLAGLVARPTVGIFDFVSGSLGIVSKHPEVKVGRVRLPRYLSEDGLVRPYVQVEAEGSMLLETLEDGRFVATDTYEYHLSDIHGTKDTVLLTNKRIMYIQNSNQREKSLAWECTWDALGPPLLNENGIVLKPTLKKKGHVSFGLRKNEKQILINSNKKKIRLLKKIQELQES